MLVCVVLFILGGYAMKVYFFGNRGHAIAFDKKPLVASPVVPAPVSIPAPGPSSFPVYMLASVPSDKGTDIELIKNIKDWGLLRAEIVTGGRVLRQYDYDGEKYTLVNNKIVKKTNFRAAVRDGASEGASKSPLGSPGDLVKNTNNSNTNQKKEIK